MGKQIYSKPYDSLSDSGQCLPFLKKEQFVTAIPKYVWTFT